jgi:hypothetical protein
MLELVDRTNLSFVDINRKRSIRFSDNTYVVKKNKYVKVIFNKHFM